MAEIFALIDCNNFYCSCERVFRPDLRDKPVLVLSNNDGCAIARSQEVKALGIKMGDPAFKLRDQIKHHRIHVFSSNYALYGDMSRRVQEVIREFTPSYEVYSIDEVFMNLAGFEHGDLAAYGQKVRQAVLQWVGIPTCVGIGPTKTLAKIANHIAKKVPEEHGVCDLMAEERRRHILESVPVEDVWGIGRATTAKLHRLGVRTAAQLRDLDPKQARKYGTVVAERMIWELRGISCLPLEEVPAAKKGTAVTRSFGKPIFELDEIIEAVTMYASRGGEKLREQNLIAGTLTVFMHTNPFKPVPQYSAAKSASLMPMTSDTRAIIEEAVRLAAAIYRKGFEYNKAGIMLDDLRDAAEKPQTLFFEDKPGSEALMAALDGINQRFGRNTLFFASQGTMNRWKLRAEAKSPSYTTRLTDVPRVRAN